MSANWIAFADRFPPQDAALDDPSVTTTRKVLVTNNLTARDRMGRMSHVWLAFPVGAVDDHDGVVAYDDGDRKIRNLTHWLDAIPRDAGSAS